MNLMLVDDHPSVRDGLRLCLQGNEQYTVVGEAGDGITAIRLARELKPDLIVMDIAMPGLNGIEATREIIDNAHTEAKIICLSVHEGLDFIAEAFLAGAHGYMIKSAIYQELTLALQEIIAGRRYVSSAIKSVVAHIYPGIPRDRIRSPFSILKLRERQILAMFAEGRSAKDIAAILGISRSAVYALRLGVMHKIGTKNMTELTEFAIRNQQDAWI